ncbi:MAG: SIS domain-containing protein, partial [Anaerolineae bacterium]|nr:SIS domain-containing protein [Anaerolineae bacterium]
TGCGSTYYLAEFAAALMQRQAGIRCRAYPGSELALFPATGFTPPARTLLIAISRSGETTETIEAVQLFKARYDGQTMLIGCYSESTLAQLTDLTLIIDSAREESIAQTRSFSSMALVVQALAGLFSGADLALDGLPGVAARLIERYGGLAEALGYSPEIVRFFFLGSDVLYGLACEAMLKMKEMSLSYSEAYHMLEFRHGPMSMVDDQTLVVGLLSDAAYRHEVAVLRDMKTRGAQVLALAEQDHGELAELGHVVALESGLPAAARAIAYLPVLQLMAFHRAIRNGQDPDHAGNLNAVVVLDNLQA